MPSDISPLIKEDNVKIIAHFKLADREAIWYTDAEEAWAVVASSSAGVENFRERWTHDQNPYGTKIASMFTTECLLLQRTLSRSEIIHHVQCVALVV